MVQCRPDFFLVSQSILGNITLADLCPGYKTDHSMITLDLSLHANHRGPGFWKLNTSFLTEIEYVNLIKSVIKDVQDEYAEDDTLTPALLWDMIKLKIREASIHYAKNKSKKIREREKALEKTISRLEKEIDKETSEPGNVDLVEKLNDLKSELEKIIEL